MPGSLRSAWWSVLSFYSQATGLASPGGAATVHAKSLYVSLWGSHTCQGTWAAGQMLAENGLSAWLTVFHCPKHKGERAQGHTARGMSQEDWSQEVQGPKAWSYSAEALFSRGCGAPSWCMTLWGRLPRSKDGMQCGLPFHDTKIRDEPFD